MKIASWNVNSIKVRLEQVLTWLETSRVDVLAIQETKSTNENFPQIEIEAAGFKVAYSGQKTYNGVCVIAKDEIYDVITNLHGLDDPQKRVLFATVSGVRIMNVYVPNGSEVGSEKFEYKLNWLEHLQTELVKNLKVHDNLVLLGDFNIAPKDEDVYDPKAWDGRILCSEPEREALNKILTAGMVDSFREFEQEEKSYSWWDYRQAAFRRNMGLRIDLILAAENMRAKLVASSIDKTPRGWERPSDHTPVIAEFDI